MPFLNGPMTACPKCGKVSTEDYFLACWCRGCYLKVEGDAERIAAESMGDEAKVVWLLETFAEGQQFAHWLRVQRHRDDPVGDFARDAHTEHAHRPRDCWHVHLERSGACREAHDALDLAWNEWKSGSRTR